MNAPKKSIRLLLIAAVFGVGSGAAAGLSTQPLLASEAAPGYGHTDRVNGVNWCHCNDNDNQCYPCSTEPPPPQN